MKTGRGIRIYPLPVGANDVNNASLKTNNFLMQLMKVNPDDQISNFIGIPTRFFIKDNMLYLSVTPDGEYEINLQTDNLDKIITASH
jgi:hypothetical protein